MIWNWIGHKATSQNKVVDYHRKLFLQVFTKWGISQNNY